MSRLRFENIPNWGILLSSAILSAIGGFAPAPVATGLTIFLLGSIASLVLRSHSRSGESDSDHTMRLQRLEQITTATQRDLQPATIHWMHLDLDTRHREIKAEQPVLGILADHLVDQLRERLTAMKGGSMELKSVVPADEYTRHWSRLLGHLLEGGGKFSTVTNIVIWSEKYFGNIKVPYASDNRAMVNQKRGTIERIFVVPPWEMLHQDHGLLERLVDTLANYRTGTQTSDGGLSDQVSVAINAKKYHQHFMPPDRRWSDNLALWHFPNGSDLSLVVEYLESALEDRYAVRSIRFTTDARVIGETRSILQFHRAASMPWRSYVDELRSRFPHLSAARLSAVEGSTAPAAGIPIAASPGERLEHRDDRPAERNPT